MAKNLVKTYGVELPRLQVPDATKYFSTTRIKELEAQGLDIVKAAERAGYTIDMPKGAKTISEFTSEVKNLNKTDSMKLLKKMGYRCRKAGGAGEDLACYMDDVKKTKAEAKKGNPTAINKQRKAFNIGKDMKGFGKILRRGIQMGTSAITTPLKALGLTSWAGYAIEGLIEGGIYDYYKRQGYSNEQAFAETFSPRLVKEGLEGKSTEDVPWYGGAEELIEQEKIGTRWDPSGKVNLAAKYADAQSKYNEALDKYSEIQNQRPGNLEQAEAQQAALEEQAAIIQALEPSVKAGTPEYEAYQTAEEKQTALMDERARDYKSKNRFLGLEWDLSPAQIKQRTPSDFKEKQMLKQREKEMEEYKGGRDANTLTWDPLNERFKDEIDWAAYGMDDEEGIKEKWRQLYEIGGMDLLDKIGIAGGVSNLAEGGIASLKRK